MSIDPGSDPAFASELAAMLHVPETPGRAFSLGAIFSFVGNVVGMVINYVIENPPPPGSRRRPPAESNFLSVSDVGLANPFDFLQNSGQR